MTSFTNQNGDLVSIVPTVVGGVVADASFADVDFSINGANAPHFILPSADGTIVVYDGQGTEVSVSVKEGQFFPCMVHGVKALGSDAIAYSYWR